MPLATGDLIWIKTKMMSLLSFKTELLYFLQSKAVQATELI